MELDFGVALTEEHNSLLSVRPLFFVSPRHPIINHPHPFRFELKVTSIYIIQSSVAAHQRVRRKVTAIISALAAGGSAAQYVTPHILKTPMYNSRHTGLQWVQELLAGHDQQFYIWLLRVWQVRE